VLFGDEVLVVCIFVFAGLVLVGGLVMLLSWVIVTIPTSEIKSCSEFERCVTPSGDENETLWADDPLADRLKMTR
jgi:hypothetical protein